MGVHPGSEGGPRPPGPMARMMSGPYTGKSESLKIKFGNVIFEKLFLLPTAITLFLLTQFLALNITRWIFIHVLVDISSLPFINEIHVHMFYKKK